MEHKVVIFLVTLLVIAQTALTGANYQNDITVQPGPVEVKQGQNIRLWCKLKYDPNKVVPVVWHTPPNFKTRANDCTSFVKDKYIMSCLDTDDPFGYYNMTIMDVQWADNGVYRCLYTKHMDIVDLQVLVPVTDVTLEKDVKSSAAEPHRLYEYFTCTTNCAFPAPKISWRVNDQPFNANATVKELGCSGAKESLKRTESRVSVMSAALTGANYQNDITVQPGPVEVKQGQNISLWCKLKYDPHKVVPVNWHSPPNFKTRTKECSSFANDKYIMSCSDARYSFRYYNMTIMDVQWADNGEYRCMYINHMGIVDLKVRVPVTDVTLEKDVKSSAAEPQRLHEYFTCTTNCAFPAPKISWLVNDQHFNGKTTVRELGCSGAREGQKQTMSTVLVMSTDMDKERKEYNIKCTAENVVGEPNVSEAMAVNNDVFRPVTPSPPQSITAKAFWPIVATALFLLLVTAISIAFIAVYERHRRQFNRDDSSREARFNEHSAPPKYEKNDGIKYHKVSTSAHDFHNAHNEEDDSSREVRFNEHSAPPKYEKNDGIKYHNVSTPAYDFHNAYNEERLLSAPTSLENGDGFGRTIVPRFF
ncbi:neural cell adhesion molecule 1-A-like isoform X2 [Lineus longissimus]|uniref:neural cell adhesion molecule 1-A-like isoform X2 n=1 Tax=Lineus longissimus TaxID=88925 RepID=UPI00315DF5A3